MRSTGIGNLNPKPSIFPKHPYDIDPNPWKKSNDLT